MSTRFADIILADTPADSVPHEVIEHDVVLRPIPEGYRLATDIDWDERAVFDAERINYLANWGVTPETEERATRHALAALAAYREQVAGFVQELATC